VPHGRRGGLAHSGHAVYCVDQYRVAGANLALDGIQQFLELGFTASECTRVAGQGIAHAGWSRYCRPNKQRLERLDSEGGVPNLHSDIAVACMCDSDPAGSGLTDCSPTRRFSHMSRAILGLAAASTLACTWLPDVMVRTVC
jgi:hypothetical protein